MCRQPTTMGKSKDEILIIRFPRLNCIKCFQKDSKRYLSSNTLEDQPAGSDRVVIYGRRICKLLGFWNPWLLGNRKHQHRHICQVVWWQNRIHNQSNRDNLRTKSQSHFQQKCDLFRFQIDFRFRPIKSLNSMKIFEIEPKFRKESKTIWMWAPMRI